MSLANSVTLLIAVSTAIYAQVDPPLVPRAKIVIEGRPAVVYVDS